MGSKREHLPVLQAKNPVWPAEVRVFQMFFFFSILQGAYVGLSRTADLRVAAKDSLGVAQAPKHVDLSWD